MLVGILTGGSRSGSSMCTARVLNLVEVDVGEIKVVGITFSDGDQRIREGGYICSSIGHYD